MIYRFAVVSDGSVSDEEFAACVLAAIPPDLRAKLKRIRIVTIPVTVSEPAPVRRRSKGRRWRADV